MARARDAKTAIMAGALALTGIFEFLEGVQEGDGLLDSAYEAIRATRIRGRAIKEAAQKASFGKRVRRRSRDA